MTILRKSNTLKDGRNSTTNPSRAHIPIKIHARAKAFGLYLLRWQLSTPILTAVLMLLPLPTIWATVVANLIGAIIFYWVDKQIFKGRENTSDSIYDASVSKM